MVLSSMLLSPLIEYFTFNEHGNVSLNCDPCSVHFLGLCQLLDLIKQRCIGAQNLFLSFFFLRCRFIRALAASTGQESARKYNGQEKNLGKKNRACWFSRIHFDAQQQTKKIQNHIIRNMSVLVGIIWSSVMLVEMAKVVDSLLYDFLMLSCVDVIWREQLAQSQCVNERETEQTSVSISGLLVCWLCRKLISQYNFTSLI